MNYTGGTTFNLDLDNVTRALEFGKLRRYQVAFNYTEEMGEVAQGASKNYTVRVTNNGTDNATFDLTVPPAQVPSGWTYNVSITNVTLEIGQSAEFYVLLNTSNQTRAGHNALQIRANPRNATGEGGSVDLGVTTRQAWGLSVGPDVQAPSDQGAVTNYYVSVANTGNGVDRVAVTVGTLPDGYTATPDRGISGNELELQPFSTQRVTVAVARQSTAPLAPAGTHFVVNVRSVSDANNTTAGSATLTIAYADLGLGNSTNATRASEPGRGDLVDRTPMTTPGFEGVVAAVAAAAAALGVRRRREGRP
jgi:uncharacterized membrane protein